MTCSPSDFMMGLLLIFAGIRCLHAGHNEEEDDGYSE
jgi:hypothetical protein